MNAMSEESNLARFDATVLLYTDQIVLKHFAHHTFLIYAIVTNSYIQSNIYEPVTAVPSQWRADVPDNTQF